VFGGFGGFGDCGDCGNGPASFRALGGRGLGISEVARIMRGIHTDAQTHSFALAVHTGLIQRNGTQTYTKHNKTQQIGAA